MPKRYKILFLCTANSCRSQIAEGFARALGSEFLEPYSAGTHPGQLHPRAITVMHERGIDISHQHSKGLEDIRQPMDLVVTVCDQAAEACPVFPASVQILHWSLPDPAQAQGTPEQVLQVFRQVRDEIEARVRGLISSLEQNALDEVGA
jgi:arsenate reductase (thioredoxin)